MKRISTIVFSILALMAVASCRRAEQEPIEWKTDLQVVKSNLVFSPEGGTETLEVNQSSVSVTSDKSWVTASASGNAVTVTVSPNAGNQSRYAVLKLTSGSESINVTVIQYSEVFDGLALADMYVPLEGDKVPYPYTTNLELKISADQPWVHIEFDEEEEGLLYVVVDRNQDFGVRKATVSYTAGSLSGSAQVIQEPKFGAVSGWTVADTDGRYVFPDQIDVISVTPPAGMADVWYFFDVIDPVEFPAGNVDDVMRAAIVEVTAQIRQLMASGEIQSMSEIAVKGSASDEFTNLPGTSKAVVMCFDDEGYPTGQYVVTDVTIPDRGPKKTVVDGWEIAHAGATYAHPDQTDRFTVTPKAGFENVKYIATVVNKEDVPSIEDYTFTTFAMETREAILAKVASGELSDFDAGLSTGVTTVEGVNVAPDAYVVVVAFGDNQFYTGDYQIAEFAVPDLMPAYYKWLGEWSVPRGDGADTWIVTENVPMESFKVSGIAGFEADEYAVGAFVAIVPYDAATGEMVFKVYENLDVTWQDSTRGTMNALLSGQYKNVEGKTYYNSGVGNVICRAKLSEDGLTADLTPGSVTSAGAPAFFYNIRWYGRYTNSSGSRSGVSWTGYETALPNVMTKQ